jgi:hypothetical protein
VRRCRAGFVRNPAAGWSLNIPQWIPAPKKSTPVDMAAVDRVVDVLTRFVGSWVTQSRKVRRAEVVSKWTREAMTPNWASIMEREERRERARARRERERLIMLTDDAWRAYCREQIRINRDVGPLMVAWVPINVERDARAAALAEQERVWQELSRGQLHNRQRAAPVRVARVVVNRGRFAALDGSDSE